MRSVASDAVQSLQRSVRDALLRPESFRAAIIPRRGGCPFGAFAGKNESLSRARHQANDESLLSALNLVNKQIVSSITMDEVSKKL
jgi:hypothetical protein